MSFGPSIHLTVRWKHNTSERKRQGQVFLEQTFNACSYFSTEKHIGAKWFDPVVPISVSIFLFDLFCLCLVLTANGIRTA